MSQYEVIMLRAFRNNGIRFVRDDRCTIVADRAKAMPVVEYLAVDKPELAAIVCTHHCVKH
jgi:hypothetical protein